MDLAIGDLIRREDQRFACRMGRDPAWIGARRRLGDIRQRSRRRIKLERGDVRRIGGDEDAVCRGHGGCVGAGRSRRAP